MREVKLEWEEKEEKINEVKVKEASKCVNEVKKMVTFVGFTPERSRPMRRSMQLRIITVRT